MALFGLFKSKRRKLRKDASGRVVSTTVDSSGILARPFPPLEGRVKSPSDLLDFAGHPQSSIRSLPAAMDKKKQKMKAKSPTPIRRPTASPPPLLMPKPKRAIPSTQLVLTAGVCDKTLLEEDPRTDTEWKQDDNNNNDSGDDGDDGDEKKHTSKRALGKHTSKISEAEASRSPPEPTNATVFAKNPNTGSSFTIHAESSKPSQAGKPNIYSSKKHDLRQNEMDHQLTALRQQLDGLQQEREHWVRREEEHRQREEQLLQTIRQLQQFSMSWNSRKKERRKTRVSSASSLGIHKSRSFSSRSNTSYSEEDNDHDGTDDADDGNSSWFYYGGFENNYPWMSWHYPAYAWYRGNFETPLQKRLYRQNSYRARREQYRHHTPDSVSYESDDEYEYDDGEDWVPPPRPLRHVGRRQPRAWSTYYPPTVPYWHDGSLTQQQQQQGQQLNSNKQRRRGTLRQSTSLESLRQRH
ncbi:hypothetical protein DFQ28_001424 [Apophysomyces sp. BC1034]|nr:hypothetical protein DFQ30_001787 [Apophysomyces sp. BC1015]KAG0183184.1 hypothetical protein DFQ29_009260 [Apophysomyces sp. BC1021]KAG0190876.1 hypothetical protein DFQ28_001424 [Apophysomyces sp. BC1034]